MFKGITIKGVKSFTTTIKGVKLFTIATTVLYTFIIIGNVHSITTQARSAWMIGIVIALIVVCLAMLCALLWSAINLAYNRGKLDMIKRVNKDLFRKK